MKEKLRAPAAVLVLAACLSTAPWAGAQESARSADEGPAARQYAAAVALQNREVYDLAADEWGKFIEAFPRDARTIRARHYLGICQLKLERNADAAATLERLIAEKPQFDLLEASYLHLGIARYQLGRGGDASAYEKAARTFAELIRDFPRGEYLDRARFYRGECLYAQDKKPEAINAYAEVIEKHPNSELVADALYAMGVARDELGDAAAARASYERFLERFPRHALAAEVTMRVGETYMAEGQPARAEKHFAAAAAVEGFALADHAGMRYAACLFDQQRYPQAAAAYAHVAEAFPESTHAMTARLWAGRSTMLDEDYPGARQLLEPLVAARSEESTEAAHLVGRCWLAEHKADKALQVVDAALAAAGDADAMRVQLALDRADALYEIPARRDEARTQFAQIAADHPRDPLAPQALYMAGFASLVAGDYQAADRYAAAFAERFAEDDLLPDVLQVAAESKLQLGDQAAAVKLYEQLIARFADHASADEWRLRRGLALYLADEHREAIVALEPLAGRLATPAAQAEAYFIVGSSYAKLGDPEAAVRVLRRSLEADPQHARTDETLLALADAYRRLNRADEAQTTVRRLIDERPGSELLDHAYFRLGEYASDARDYAAAIDAYGRVLDRWPDSELVPAALNGLGWAHLNSDDPPRAVEVLTRLIDAHPEHAVISRARYVRALALYQRKDYAPAIEDLRAFIASSPPRGERCDALYALALCQVGAGQAGPAVETCRALLADDADYARADRVWYEMAWALRSQGETAAAADAFAQLAERHADSPLAAEALFFRGEDQYEAGDFEAAAKSFYAAMNGSEENALGEKAAHKLGWAYFRQEKFDEAVKTFRYQRATYPGGELAADAAFMLAECLFKQSDFDAALEAYAAVDAPSSEQFAALALLHAGQAAGQLKRWDESIGRLEQCIEQHPDSPYKPEAMYELAWARQNAGQVDEAIKGYEAVTAATDAEVAARARFMIGEIQFERKNHGEAVRNFFKVAYGYAYPQWQAAAHYEAGRCFEVLGKTEQAVKSYREVVEKFPDSQQAPQARERLDALSQ